MAVDIWDTAGQEQFSSLHPSYYYGAHACIMVFDATRKVTYNNLRTWWDELQEYCKGVPTFVVANKIDEDYGITTKSFKACLALAASNGMVRHNPLAVHQTPAPSLAPVRIRAGPALLFRLRRGRHQRREGLPGCDRGRHRLQGVAGEELLQRRGRLAGRQRRAGQAVGVKRCRLCGRDRRPSALAVQAPRGERQQQQGPVEGQGGDEESAQSTLALRWRSGAVCVGSVPGQHLVKRVLPRTLPCLLDQADDGLIQLRRSAKALACMRGSQRRVSTTQKPPALRPDRDTDLARRGLSCRRMRACLRHAPLVCRSRRKAAWGRPGSCSSRSPRHPPWAAALAAAGVPRIESQGLASANVQMEVLGCRVAQPPPRVSRKFRNADSLGTCLCFWPRTWPRSAPGRPIFARGVATDRDALGPGRSRGARADFIRTAASRRAVTLFANTRREAALKAEAIPSVQDEPEARAVLKHLQFTSAAS